MLKGSVLCMKLNEKKETEVSVQKLVQCGWHHGETKQIRRWTEVHIPPVRYACLSTQSPRSNRKNHKHNTKRGRSLKTTITKIATKGYDGAVSSIIPECT